MYNQNAFKWLRRQSSEFSWSSDLSIQPHLHQYHHHHHHRSDFPAINYFPKPLGRRSAEWFYIKLKMLVEPRGEKLYWMPGCQRETRRGCSCENTRHSIILNMSIAWKPLHLCICTEQLKCILRCNRVTRTKCRKQLSQLFFL